MNEENKKNSYLFDENGHIHFDFCLSNPPYQLARETTKDMPIYHYFIDAGHTIAEESMMITPGRYLFNAGATPKDWNNKVLNDPNFKIDIHEADSSKLFHNVDIKGGVAVSLYSKNKQHGAIETFTPYKELNSIRNKIIKVESLFLNTIMYPYSTYTLSEKIMGGLSKAKSRSRKII